MTQRILTATCLGGLMLAGCATASADPFPEGLWQWSAPVTLDMADLTIDCADTSCIGTLNGNPVSVDRDGTRITLDGGDRMSFSGTLPATPSGELVGWWQQEADNLAYYTTRTPARLTPTGTARWEGRSRLQTRSFRMNLDVFRDDDGDLRAVLQNPERNEILGSRPFRLEDTADGTGWTVLHANGDREERLSLSRSADGTLRLDHPFFDDAISLQRAANDAASGYRARPVGQTAQGYTEPEPLDDGWITASANDLGFGTTPLDRLVASLSSTDPRSDRPMQIHAILAAQGDRLFLEEYFHGHDAQDRHDVRSLGKVFGSVMLGTLDQSGYEVDLDAAAVSDYLASVGDPPEDPRLRDITTAHLLTYSSGLDCNSNDASLGSETRMWNQQEEPDFWRFFATLPVLHPAGTRYAYCSGSANMVGSVIRAVSGRPVLDVFDTRIARPLQFGPYHWNLSPNGEA
ncbi:MAG: serine hydrolase domain-containing protein, partial [Litorimonas sp.]